jgi:hypothetical protein
MALDIESLEDSPHLLELLIQMEDVLDSLDLYVFKNWSKGEIVEGPVIRRYWLNMTLRYLIDDMPDPRAGFRLLRHGVRLDYAKIEEEDTGKVWHVTVSIPRRLCTDIASAQLDFYDEEIDQDDVLDAQDTGLDDETGLTDGNETGATDDFF